MSGLEGDEAADRTLGRLLAFSDGVFAIAITLLVLSLEVPPGQSDAELATHLHGLIPQLGSAALSFLVIGRFWIAHHGMFSYVRRADGPLSWLNLAFLGPIVLIPFTTQLLGDYGDVPVAVMAYAGTIAASACAEAAIWVYAVRGRRLVGAGVSRGVVVDTSVGIGVTAVVFLASVPVALVSPVAAILLWPLAAFPTRRYTARFHGDAR